MTPTDYLQQHGWILIKDDSGKYHNIKYWNHPDHQPNRRGMFTTSKAEAHQKMLDSGGRCQCIPKEQPR